MRFIAESVHINWTAIKYHQVYCSGVKKLKRDIAIKWLAHPKGFGRILADISWCLLFHQHGQASDTTSQSGRQYFYVLLCKLWCAFGRRKGSH